MLFVFKIAYHIYGLALLASHGVNLNRKTASWLVVSFTLRDHHDQPRVHHECKFVRFKRIENALRGHIRQCPQNHSTPSLGGNTTRLWVRLVFVLRFFLLTTTSPAYPNCESGKRAICYTPSTTHEYCVRQQIHVLLCRLITSSFSLHAQPRSEVTKTRVAWTNNKTNNKNNRRLSWEGSCLCSSFDFVAH